MISRLHKRYRDTVAPALQKELGLSNRLAVPKVSKVVVNVGFGKHLKDGKHEETVIDTLKRITGQQPIQTKAKKSIAAFKLREGMIVGATVTLRGERMWEFLDKFMNVTLARVRDFHGIDPKGLGQSGTLTVGMKEHIVFPEIGSDEVEHLHGLEVTIVTTAKARPAAQALLTHLGFPFSTT
ncbi:MAG: 50S ribosomal protein L5 [Candidatus Kerfeldbacteria bacterium]|nr:50S ribosomal protein L5 [Candidatus Kerfeldbacteria bacterium]